MCIVAVRIPVAVFFDWVVDVGFAPLARPLQMCGGFELSRTQRFYGFGMLADLRASRRRCET